MREHIPPDVSFRAAMDLAEVREILGELLGRERN